jgi:aminopeptidase N
MTRLFFLSSSLFFFSLISCSITKKEASIISKSNTNQNDKISLDLEKNSEVILPTKRAEYHEARTVLTDIIHTKLEVNFDWSKSQMNGVATITAKPHFYASDSLFLDAQAMEIKSILLGGKPLIYAYSNEVISIKLDREYKKTEKYTVQITYVSKPEELAKGGGSKAITDDKGLYFINPKGEIPSKMPQIWTQGETQSNSVWFPTIDSPNSKSTEEILITVDSKYTTLSNGNLISSKTNSDGTRTDHWKQDLPHAPYLFMMGIGEFKVVKDFYTRPDGSKMEVNYYVEPEWESSAKAIFGETPNMIKYFSELLGVEYPWDKYSQIVVRDYVSGAMENTGAVVFGDYAYKNERELLDGNDQSTIAHELFHHWFGDLVTAESWSNLTLNESFANYSQYLWDEHKFGLDEAAYQAENEADGYFQSAENSAYHNLVWFDFEDKEEMFDGHSYNKGGRILHILRCYLGDEAFFKGINLYLTTNKFKSAEFNQLRLAFEEVCGEDLNWFFNQWYLGAGHPILDFKQSQNKENKSVTVTINQVQNLEMFPIFKLPMQIAVFDSLGKHIYKVVVDELKEQFTFSYTGTLNCVLFDDQQMLLAKIREEKPLSQYEFQYYNGKTYKARKDGFLQATTVDNDHPEKLILDALSDPFWYIRILAIEKAPRLKNEFKTKGIDIIKSLAINDPNSEVRADAISYLTKNMEASELETFLTDRISKDQSYIVVAICLNSIGKSNPKVAVSIAKKLEIEKSSAVLLSISQIYGGHGSPESFQFFEQLFKSGLIQGYDQIGAMNSFTLYNSIQDIEINEKSFAVFEFLSKNGDHYIKMFFPKFINYFQKMYGEKIIGLKAELEVNEKNKDVVYANQNRLKIKRYEALIVQFTSLIEIKK